MPFGREKLEWLGYPTKILKICLFVVIQSTNVTDRQTNTQTHRHRITAKAALDAIASRGKTHESVSEEEPQRYAFHNKIAKFQPI